MKRIAVIRFSALGDVAMLVPVVKGAAERQPDTEFTIVSRQQTAPLWTGLPANVVFYGADLKGRHHGLKGLNLLLHEIDYKRFDAVADMHSVLRSWFLDLKFFLSGIKVRRIHKGRFEKQWLTCRLNKHKHPIKRTVQRYIDVFSALEIQTSVSEPCFAHQSDGKEGIGIAPFAAQQGKILPLDKMEQLVSIVSQNEKVYLFGGGKHEVEILDKWANKYNNVTNMAGKYKMADEIAFMSTLRVMVTMDSGNMHLASLAGTRVVSIWGATHKYAGFLGWGQSESDCVELDLSCRPCSVYGNKKCRRGDYACLNNIDINKIIELIR